jgi:acyl carrier protein
LNDDGSVSVIGRLKELINRGGAVVPPVLVEDQLLEHSDVSQAIAFGVSHPTLDQDLIAGVVPRPGSAPDPLQLRLWLAERVAPERVPRQILLLDAIPLNAIGKPERRLAGDILKDRLNGNAGAAATGPVQGILAEIMGDLLARAPLAQAEDFFWAGGDSLMLMRLQLQIEEIFGVILPADDIALAPTIDRIEPLIAARIEAARMAAIDAAWHDAQD